ncbi:MAG: hypothetical protein RJA63_3478 [Pseudomonadota bacterium]|jgi:DNA-binding NtrC family response regulator
MTGITHPLPELVSLLEAAPEPHALLDQHYRILVTNAAYREHAKGEGSVLGRRCYEVSHHYSVPCDQAQESCPLAQCRQSGKRERVLHLHHTPRGEEYVSIELTPIRDGAGEIVYFLEKMEALPVARGLSASNGLVGRSPAFREMLRLLTRVARSEAAVLLEGESGTGKELLANALHQASSRATAPFIAVDCSGIPENLFESELFGHERGAFTGAVSRRTGLVTAASGGTLFLDEVGDIPLGMQVKLLRLLETGSYRSVGSNELKRADIRVVSATHRNLRSMVADRAFRADLYYRLNTFPIPVPALRDRRDDIPRLAESLLARVSPTRKLSISAEALAALRRHPFPGNIRELRNLLERASLLCDHDEIGLEHLPADVLVPRASGVAEAAQGEAETEEQVATLLASHQGSRKALAQRLGVSERTLYRRIQALRGRSGD